MTPKLKPAVFLDRDGTLIEEKNYLHKPEDVSVFRGVPDALQRLKDAGYLLFIVSNQSGVGRGYFTIEDVHKVNARMIEDMGVPSDFFQAIYLAPEAPDQPSRGRKPSPQFLFDARDAFGVDLAKSWVIGDKMIDLECGWNAGTRGSILVRTGYGAKTEAGNRDRLGNALVVDSLGQAAEHILSLRS